MKRYYNNITLKISIFFLLLIPFNYMYADNGLGLIPCDNIATKCNFSQFMNLINTIIHFLLFDLSIPVAAVMFAYAGFLMITAGGEAAQARTKAKNIFTNAAIGLVIMATAWLIVKTILLALGYQGAWIGL